MIGQLACFMNEGDVDGDCASSSSAVSTTFPLPPLSVTITMIKIE